MKREIHLGHLSHMHARPWNKTEWTFWIPRKRQKERKSMTWLRTTCLVLLSATRGFSRKKVFYALVRFMVSHCWASNIWSHCSMCECVIVRNCSLFVPRRTYTMDHRRVIFVFFFGGVHQSARIFLCCFFLLQITYQRDTCGYSHSEQRAAANVIIKYKAAAKRSVCHSQIQFGIFRFNDFGFNVILYDKDLYSPFSPMENDFSSCSRRTPITNHMQMIIS